MLPQEVARAAGLAAFPVLLAAGLAVAPPAPSTEVRRVAVADGIHYLVGDGGNVVVMTGADGALMVDDKFERHAKAIEAALKDLGAGELAWLVNTHWHGDHTGGNAHFGAAATIVSHENARARLAGDSALGGRVAEPAAQPPALPTVTFDAALSLFWNGEEVKLLHLGPGHTDGDTVVWFTGSKVVHMGDLYFQLGYPFIDLASGGDVLGVVESCKRVLELVPADARFVPGHGEATDAAGLREYVAMIETSLERVRAARAKGMGAEEMLAAGLLDDLNARWGGFGFVPPKRWLETLVEYAGR